MIFNGLFIFNAYAHVNAHALKAKAPNCCSVSCKLGSCNINGSASGCSCSCTVSGNPRCNGDAANSISANEIQMENIDAVLVFFESLNSTAANIAITALTNIKNLFINNDYLLEDQDGNVSSYNNYRNSLDNIIESDFTDRERNDFIELLNGMSEG